MKYELKEEDIVELPYYQGETSLKMWLPDREDFIQKYIATNRRFYSEFDSILSDIPRNSNIVDVGAHIGSTVLWFSRVANAEHITAIEPNEYIGSILEANVVLNSLQDKIDIVHAAAGAKSGFAKLAFSCQTNTGASIYRPCDTNDTDAIPVVTLDSIFTDGSRRVDVLKIDVEGSELDVLNGAENIIIRDKPLIIIEIWVPGTRTEDPNFDTMHNYFNVLCKLHKFGYTMKRVLGNDNFEFVME